MNYTPHTWVNNETITAAKLNNLEDGIQKACYDAEISVTHSYENGLEFSILHGNYADLAELLNNNISPIILIRFWSSVASSGYTKAVTTAIALYAYEPNASVPYIVFAAKIPMVSENGTYSDEWFRFTFSWNANNEVSY